MKTDEHEALDELYYRQAAAGFPAEVVKDDTIPGAWRVEKLDSDGDGGIDLTIFDGSNSEARACEYAAWKYGVQHNERREADDRLVASALGSAMDANSFRALVVEPGHWIAAGDRRPRFYTLDRTMNEQTTDFVPSAPTPEITTLVAALIRHLLTIGGTLGVVHGVYSDSAVSIIAGALVGVGMIGWSLHQKIAAKRADHVGSVASAMRGVAVQST